MSYGYSDDLRKAALAYYDRGGASQVEVSDIFGICVKTFNSWISLRKKGEVTRRAYQKPKGAVKLDEAALRQYITDNPDAYNHEVGAQFGVCANTILYARRRLGISRKKNGAVSGT